MSGSVSAWTGNSLPVKGESGAATQEGRTDKARADVQQPVRQHRVLRGPQRGCQCTRDELQAELRKKHTKQQKKMR
jgi:hypothetical protein